MKQKKDTTRQIEKISNEKELLIKEWQKIEAEINYLAQTDRSNLSWRELLSRPHECSN